MGRVGNAAVGHAHPKFWLVGHNAFGPTNNWPACSLVQLSPAEARVTHDSSAKIPDDISLSSSMLMMVNSIRCRILLIVCDIFLHIQDAL